jgi:Cytochrome P460
MTRIAFLLVAAATGASVVASMATTSAAHADDGGGAPIYVTKIPAGYRDWKFISVAREEHPLEDVRAILGNDKAIKAYREGKFSFPDGAIIARLAWSYLPSAEHNKVFGRDGSYVAGLPKNGVQFMVKDAKKYASTGGWGFGQFDDGKLADETILKTCFPCHEAVQTCDRVFTRYAP